MTSVKSMSELIVSLILTHPGISTTTLATDNTTLPMYPVFPMLASSHDDQMASISVTTPTATPKDASPHLRTVNLDGENFTYDQMKLPPPPGIHFSDDISGLFTEWNDSQLLIVEGRGIAIKYWRLFYNERESSSEGTWSSSVRNEWGKWRVRRSSTYMYS